MAQNSRRGRSGRRRSGGGGNNPNRSMDSQGPEVKIRGNAQQIYDKYTALARDAFSSGDRIRGESLQQHAEHYYRVLQAMKPPEQRDDQNQRDGRDEDDEQGSAKPDGANAQDGRNERRSGGDADQSDAEVTRTEEPSRAAEPSGRKAVEKEGTEATETDATGASQDEAGEDAPKPRRTRRRRRKADDEESGSSAEQEREDAPAA